MKKFHSFCYSVPSKRFCIRVSPKRAAVYYIYLKNKDLVFSKDIENIPESLDKNIVIDAYYLHVTKVYDNPMYEDLLSLKYSRLFKDPELIYEEVD